MASTIWVHPAGQASRADEPPADTITDLGEISDWLGTYRERLREARDEDRQQLTSGVTRWTVRYQQRRSELAERSELAQKKGRGKGAEPICAAWGGVTRSQATEAVFRLHLVA
jgi:hypothetical protein